MNDRIYLSAEGIRFCIVGENRSYYICKGVDIPIMNSIKKMSLEKNKPVYMCFRERAVIDTTCVQEYQEARTSRAFLTWYSILDRVGKKRYKNVGISEDWLYFSNFKRFFDKNYYDGFVIDKDILSSPGCKMYSAETCCFIPKELNSSIMEFSKEPHKLHFKNGEYYFTICDQSENEFIHADNLKQLVQLYAVYRCVKVKSILSLHYHHINGKAIKKLKEYYNINRYAEELYQRIMQGEKG